MIPRCTPVFVITNVLLTMGLTPAIGSTGQNPHELWYRQPAGAWVEALPLGNGRLGTMVAGRIGEERLIINENTLWGKAVNRDRLSAGEHLDAIRRLVFDGRYVEAEQLAQQEILAAERRLSNRPLGQLLLRFGGRDDVTDYRRSLDLDTAVATISFRRGQTVFRREFFISPVHQVMVIRLTADAPGAITFDVALTRDASVKTSISNDSIGISGAVEEGGVRFASGLAIACEGGRCVADDGCVRIAGAAAATLFLAAASDYRQENPAEVLRAQLKEARATDYAELRRRHVEEHRRLFRRVELNLGRPPEEPIPTDARLHAVARGQNDPQLISQLFQFGRYLLICSSRPGCMPAHLQGIWVQDLVPQYNCAYHLNINIEMNYWPAEVCNLSECHRPLFDFIDRLRPNGRATARDVYGCRGFVLHHNVDGTLTTGPFGKVEWGLWPSGAAWVCQHIWEHYRFGGDREFLSRQGYPIMREAALFFLDYLVEDPRTGKLVFGPSVSPENFYRTRDGKTARIMMGGAMDQALAWELFSNCLAAAAVLGQEDECTREIRAALARLGEIQIGSDGRILEWGTDEVTEIDPGHRHLSPLYAMHPGCQITPRKSPRLAAAIRQSLEKRRGARQVIPWSQAWKISFWARFREAEIAHDVLIGLLASGRVMTSLFATMGPQRVIMDANGGVTAGIAEMLIQSHDDRIELLPALPKAWRNGSVRGLRARGGFVAEMDWEDGELVSANIRSERGETLRLSANEPIWVITKGQIVASSNSAAELVELPTTADAVFSIQPQAKNRANGNSPRTR